MTNTNPFLITDWLKNRGLIIKGEDNKSNPTLLGHIVLTGSLIGIVLASHAVIYITTIFWQNSWLTCDAKKDIPFTKSPTMEQLRLNEQSKAIQELTNKNCKIMAFFYKQYFICLSIGGTAALVALVCIFFLSKEGWEKSNNALINISVTAFGVTTFYLNFTQIFQQDQNLTTSQDLYAKYSALQNTFSSSIVLAVPTPSKTGLSQAAAGTVQPMTYAELIQDTDIKLNTLGYIRLGFDPTPISEIQNKANSIFGVDNAPPASVKVLPTAKSTPLVTPPAATPKNPDKN
ncbi:MAG: hypothetical protein WCD18_18275 [Thermosynechococcaceae cyanobacterium]